MLIRVEFIGDDWSYSHTYDISDYADGFETDKEFLEYVKFGEFNIDGTEPDFVVGELECLFQSDYCPPIMYNKDVIKVRVTRV